jgi:hypothetical protein
MVRLFRALFAGAAAGAAGTTALNAITYVDMVVRARPPSDLPEQLVERLSAKSGIDIPGEGAARANRIAGLGPLSGLAVGIGIGVGFAVLRAAGFRPPPLAASVLVGGAAMLAADGPMVRLHLTDPWQWSVVDWGSDAIPHLGYGLVTTAVLAQLDR